MRIDRKIITTTFACDLHACKGACCTFPGGSGAPVRANEVELLRKAWDVVKDEVPEEHRSEVAEFGLFEHDGEELTIRCHDDRACVFVVYEDDVAKCTIQNRYFKGEFDWPKPISCHLFPVRVRRGKTNHLRFEKFSECSSAHDAGAEQNLPLVSFLEVPLTRAFGADVYRQLRERSDRHHADNGKEL